MILRTIRDKLRIGNLTLPQKEGHDVHEKYPVDHDSRS